jgi:ATP-binding cassette subfamily B protein
LSAEKIIVLDDGKIVGVGTHQQLLKDCNVYREIAYSQLSEDELKSYQIDVNREKAEIEKKDSLSLSENAV